jgi:hypothetical protein
LAKAAQVAAEAVAAVKLGAAKQQWPLSEHGRHGQRSCSDLAADGWAPAVSDFSNLSKTGSTLKNQNLCLKMLQKFQIFACA